MPPAPIPNNEALRLAALLDCAILDTAPEDGFDDLTALAARLCQTPIALVSLVDHDRQWFKSRIGMTASQTPRSHAFCAYAIQSPGPLIVPDATKDPRVCDSPLVTGEPHIRFYAGFPLITSDGLALGTLCVVDTRPRQLTHDQLDDLCSLARQATTQLELRRTIKQLNAAQRQAVAASEAKAAFLATMSHEIRTPLTAVLGYLDLALEHDISEVQRREYSLTIKRNADHLLGLVNDILDISKIESGNMTVESASCSPSLKVWDVMHMFSPRFKDGQVLLTARFETPIPVRITSDGMRIRQILVNLVSNATKFTASGSVELSAALLQRPSGPVLQFRVTDTGIGMTDDQLARLFQPFTQADCTTSRRFGGSGLGLTISRHFARLLGGELTVRSAFGQGSEFILIIPVSPDDCRELISDWHDAPSTRPPAKPVHTRLAGRVLLAEDGIDNQRLIKHLLTRAGLSVEIVADGQQALDRVRSAALPFDLVLMDMHMPILDGIDATKRLRELGYSMPILALTANASTQARTECLRSRCDDFLTKPIDQVTLLQACARFLRAEPTLQAAA